MSDTDIDDIVIKKKDPEYVKFFKYAKYIGVLGAAAVAIFTVAGQVYNVPQKIEAHSKTLEMHAQKLTEEDKTLNELHNDVYVNKQSINTLQKSIEDINIQQKVSTAQNIEVNKSLIELNTTIKFFNENLKEMKQDVRTIKEHTTHNKD